MTRSVNRSCIGLVLRTVAFLSLQNVSALSDYGFTKPMPYSSVDMYGDRAKRSLATLCMEIKPNGPLEEPYYMCKGADFPQFSKLPPNGNIATANYGSFAGARDILGMQSSTPFNGPPFNDREGAISTSTFLGLPKKFSAESEVQGSQRQFENQAFLHQQSKQISNSQSQRSFNIDVNTKPFREETPAGGNFQKPNEQHQQHFNIESPLQFHPVALQQQQQHQPQQNHQNRQFQTNQQFVVQPVKNIQSSFRRMEQFFRPGESIEKPNGYDSIYDGFIPPASYSTQHNADFGTHSQTAPFYQSDATTTAPATDASSFASHSNQGLEPSLYSLRRATDCGEACGKAINQATPSSHITHNGAIQFAAKSTVDNSGCDAHNPKFFDNGGISSQHASSAPAPLANRYDQNTPTFPSISFPAADLTRTSSASSFRYGGNGAATFTTNVGSSVSDLGPNDTPPLGSAFWRPVSNVPYYPTEAPFSEVNVGVPRGQDVHRHNIEAQQNNQHLQHFQHLSKLIPTESMPPTQRYRSMIDDEVLQMPKWGFSADELDLYRHMPVENKNSKAVMSNMPFPATTSPRKVPLEHFEDPVMRAFYSSLDDIEPIPSFPTAHTPIQLQPREAYAMSPQLRMPYLLPTQSCSQPLAQPYYNYNPFPLQRDYNFQPVLIALPCYGQSLCQTCGSAAPLPATGNTVTHPLGSMHTQTAIHTQQQSEVQTGSTHFSAKDISSKNENTAILGSVHNVQNEVSPKTTASTTVATTTKEDSNESGESQEDSTPTVTKTSLIGKKSDALIGSGELKSTTSERPKIVKFEIKTQDAMKPTTEGPSASVDIVGAPNLATTPPSADVMGSEMSTTFRSLILTARKLAKMVTTSQEEDESMYKDELSTPKPASKKVRHVSRSMPKNNGSGGHKRRYI